MRRVFLLTSALLVVASIAHAVPGVNMRWTNCFGDGGAFNRNFACNTNAGNNVLVGSFVLGTPMQASGNEMIIDLASASSPLPAWWAFKNTGTCRQTSLSTSGVVPLGSVACLDWANGLGFPGVASYTIGFAGPNTARVLMVSATGQPYPNLLANQEYFSFNLIINNAKTVGAPACAGCSEPVCLRLVSIKVTSPTAANNQLLSGPTNATDSHFVTWQGGAGSCLAATPARQETWGAVKSLYR